MKLSKRQQTPEVMEAVNHARQLGAEAYRNGIRRPHDDAAVVAVACEFNDSVISAEIWRAWLQGATRAMFAMMEA